MRPRRRSTEPGAGFRRDPDHHEKQRRRQNAHQLQRSFRVSDPTTCTDFITTGYDAAVLADEFNKSYNGSPYTRYDGDDFRQLYQRRNDRTENPDRPWVVQKNGKYMYYSQFQLVRLPLRLHPAYVGSRPEHSGGNEKFNYLVSGNHYTKEGLYAQNTDKYTTNNLNMKFGAQVKPWLSINGAAPPVPFELPFAGL